MSLLHPDDDLEPEQAEREVTLSTGAILGLFAGLVLLCAVFFAFGYMVRGRQIPAPVVVAAAPDAAPASTANFGAFKPAAGSPAAGTTPATHSTLAGPAAEPVEAEHEPAPVPHVPAEAAPLSHPAPASAPHATPAPPASLAAAASIPAGSFIVQVAAMSHEEDASLLVTALKAKGYPASARTESQDKLFHIQVGPYATHQAADAIKARLSADGYNNPIVK